MPQSAVGRWTANGKLITHQAASAAVTAKTNGETRTAPRWRRPHQTAAIAVADRRSQNSFGSVNWLWSAGEKARPIERKNAANTNNSAAARPGRAAAAPLTGGAAVRRALLDLKRDKSRGCLTERIMRFDGEGEEARTERRAGHCPVAVQHQPARQPVAGRDLAAVERDERPGRRSVEGRGGERLVVRRPRTADRHPRGRDIQRIDANRVGLNHRVAAGVGRL